MRDIPVFTTQNGVASLILREVLYKKEAYIRIQSSEHPKELINEASDFCKAVGAERIYATGHSYLERFPLHTELVRMTCNRSLLPYSDATVERITDQTIDRWRTVYNEKMASVPNAATITFNDAKRIVDDGSAYFAFKDNACIGFGKVSGNTIEAIGSLMPGSGECVLLALAGLISGESVQVEVALNNHSAVKLYKRLGFVINEEISKWYCIQ